MTAEEARAARHASGAHAGGGCRPRPALGPRRGNLRRRSLSGRATGHRRRARISRAMHRSRDKKRVIATLKHFAAHGQPESGMNCAPVNVSARVLRETFLYHVQRGHPKSRRHQRDGLLQRNRRRAVARQPMAAARRAPQGMGLQRLCRFRLLRHLGTELSARHARPFRRRRQKRSLRAGRRSAGVNIELPEPDCYLHLVELVRKGVLKESQLDELVAPMLFWKFKLGLFDDPYVDPDEAERVVGCESNRELALQAARETITLLKNEGRPGCRSIPAKSKPSPSSARMPTASLLGGYSGVPKHIRHGARWHQRKVGDRVKVLYSEGCKITVGGSWNQDEVAPSDPEEDRKQIAEAVEVAKQGRCHRAGHRRQRTDLARSLDPEAHGRPHQPRSDRAAGGTGRRAWLATGKPVIVFLFNGRPLSINYLAENVPVIFECWYLGQETGHAVADVLFGDLQPRRQAAHHHSAFGRTSAGVLQLQAVGPARLSVRRRLAALPVRLRPELHDVRVRERRGWRRKRSAPTNPRGSWSTSPTPASAPGTEVVQMYIRDCVSSVTRPVKELKGFQKISLRAGRNQDRRARHHARVAGVLRHRHEIRRRTGRI